MSYSKAKQQSRSKAISKAKKQSKAEQSQAKLSQAK
jgi:hypothetical protein